MAILKKLPIHLKRELVNSGFINGMQVVDAKNAIIDWFEKEGIGERKVNYKLRDWVFSRQRYWGGLFPLCTALNAVWFRLMKKTFLFIARS